MRVFTINMNEDDIKTVLEGLMELPYKKSGKLVRDFESVLLLPLMNKPVAETEVAKEQPPAMPG